NVIILEPIDRGSRSSGESNAVTTDDRFYEQAAPAQLDDSNSDLPF
ncbi:MAG: hypothetical protein HYV28_02970, partial [Ignavibacteriales bacterium]|nr:hypothetical protein [Ignavibacteriales bacterium]